MALEVGEDLDGLATYGLCLLDVHGDLQLGMSLGQAQGDDGAEIGVGGAGGRGCRYFGDGRQSFDDTPHGIGGEV